MADRIGDIVAMDTYGADLPGYDPFPMMAAQQQALPPLQAQVPSDEPPLSAFGPSYPGPPLPRDSEAYRHMREMEQDGMDPKDRAHHQGQGVTLDRIPNYAIGNQFKSQLPPNILMDPSVSGVPVHPFPYRARSYFDT